MISRRRLSVSLYVLIACFLTITGLMLIELPTGTDYIIYIFFILTFVWLTKKPWEFPKAYKGLLCFGVLVIFLNVFLTRYHVPLLYAVLGFFITYLPFVHFAVSYNYHFTLKDVMQYANWLTITVLAIGLFVILETVFFFGNDDKEGVIGSNIFGIGFFASNCNQILVLALGRYILTNKSFFVKLSLIIILFVLLTVQLKAIVGSMIILVGYVFFTAKSKYVKFVLPSLFFSLFILVAFTSEKIQNKVANYQEIYMSDDAVNGVARTALYFTAAQIAFDNFPLGTGQGTYSSVPFKMLSDDVYQDYGINKIHGLTGESPDFRLDTHWAYILGENGVLGMIIYLCLFFYPLWQVMKFKDRNPEHRMYRFVISMSVFTLFVESFALPLPNRLGMIFIYSGLSGIILRRLSSHNY